MRDSSPKHLGAQGHTELVESVPDEVTSNVSSKLTLEVSRVDDNDIITCAVDHPSLAPGDMKTQLTLRVLYSPDVQILPESNLPREGEKFYLQCLGNGNPEPAEYKWDKKDEVLPPQAKVDGAYLRFESLNKSDNGVYLCYADNGIGNSQGEYTLLVQVTVGVIGVYNFTENIPDPTAMSTSSGVDHAVIGGVVAVIVFILLCLLIVLGRYLIRHKVLLPSVSTPSLPIHLLFAALLFLIFPIAPPSSTPSSPNPAFLPLISPIW
ncbi:cell adhesion molecule 3-like [Notothenia coriiceps]|uniref:Cell adhesion molecule 3-like n=1 Tax=Notothenia coriiceps TaxID=8208 RepID=A0A6I9NZ86_9TELE|nr:PREDICTED: cell adhesion molecule 3-like [Notothenia coriiceps]